MELIISEQLLNVHGGSISSSIINSINKMVSTIFSLGQAFGSALRRTYSRRWC